MIWIEQLRCWPGDVVLDALKGWPSRKDGQWWPTWHDVEAELRAATSLRQAIVTHIDSPAIALEAPPELSADERKAVADKFAAMTAKMGEPERQPVSQRDLSPAEKADLFSNMVAERDTPVAISPPLAALLQKQTAEEDQARQHRAHSASQNGRAA